MTDVSVETNTEAVTADVGENNNFAIPEQYSNREYLKGVQSINDVYGKLDEAMTFKIPDEFKEEASLQNIKNMNDLFKGYVNAQKLIGKKTVTPEIPQDIKDYGLDGIDNNILDMLKNSGVPKDLAPKLVENYNKMVSKEFEVEPFKEMLLKELGNDTKEIDQVHFMVEDRFGDNLKNVPNSLKLDIYKAFADIRKEFAINKPTIAGNNNANGKDTIEGLQSSFSKTLNNLDNAKSESEKIVLRKELLDLNNRINQFKGR